MKNETLVNEINKSMAMALPEEISPDELQIRLAACINRLIRTDFPQLVIILYRIDVNEQKLKQLLLQHPEEDAGKIIAALIIERQLQKIKTRRQFRQAGNDYGDEEKW